MYKILYSLFLFGITLFGMTLATLTFAEEMFPPKAVTVPEVGSDDWRCSGGAGRIFKFVDEYPPMMCQADLLGSAVFSPVKAYDRVLEVTVNGQSSVFWNSDAVMFEPRQCYRFSVFAHSPTGASGCTPVGTNFIHRDFTAFDREMERVMHEYRFTNFQSHLKEKKWLDKSYCYWFDEPDPKDYDFVADGFGLLQKYVPGLPRMITEEPGDAFIEALQRVGANINIRCPVSYNDNPMEAQKRMAAGERFWWYVCMGPKAPYCTLFIDHPGTEMRVWCWQAFQRNITGLLVWESTYWTSNTAYPDLPQNPYLDPMGYVVNSSLVPGTKQFWGNNGDGPFIYPPLEATLPGGNDGKPIIKPPVSSIRWEML